MLGNLPSRSAPMLCGLQLGLVALGVWLMRKREVRVGDQVAPAPTPMMMGLVLVLQLPAVLIVGLLIGVSAGVGAAKKMQSNPNPSRTDQAAAQKKLEADMTALQSKYWWLDLAIPAGALAIAGVILALGLKDPEPRPKARRREVEELPDDGYEEEGYGGEDYRRDDHHRDEYDDYRRRARRDEY